MIENVEALCKEWGLEFRSTVIERLLDIVQKKNKTVIGKYSNRSNKKEILLAPLLIILSNPKKITIGLFGDSEWSKWFHKPFLLHLWSNPSIGLLGLGKHYKNVNKKLK